MPKKKKSKLRRLLAKGAKFIKGPKSRKPLLGGRVRFTRPALIIAILAVVGIGVFAVRQYSLAAAGATVRVCNSAYSYAKIQVYSYDSGTKDKRGATHLSRDECKTQNPPKGYGVRVDVDAEKGKGVSAWEWSLRHEPWGSHKCYKGATNNTNPPNSKHEVVYLNYNGKNCTRGSSSVASAPGSGKWRKPINAGLGAHWKQYGVWAKWHTGQDFPAGGGTNVYAVTSGTTTCRDWVDWDGYSVMLKMDGGGSMLYAHLQKGGRKCGERVSAGEHIGDVGLSGRTFGYHLHLEYCKNATTRPCVYNSSNPVTFLRGKGVNL